MKGKTRIFKLMFTMLLTLAVALVIVACGGNTDAKDVESAKSALVIEYKTTGDNKDSVTGDLGLPIEGDKGVSITWTSSHPTVVSTAGKVTRQSADTTVTLTATLEKGKADDNKIFTVKVMAQEATVTPQEALAALEITGEDLVLSGNMYTTTKDIVLPATSLGHEVNWESLSSAITVSGVVTRPAYGQPTVRVVLSAIIGAFDREFIVDVLAITEMPASQVLATASQQLNLPSLELVEDVTLTPIVNVEGVGTDEKLYVAEVSWETSNASVVSAAGVVSRPALGEEDVLVTLTATLSHKGETVEKEFEVRVLAETTEHIVVANFAEAEAAFLATGTLSDRVYIKVQNVSLIGKLDDGLMFIDEDGVPFFAFGSNSNAYRDAKEGVLYDVLGNFADYFGVTQINGTGSQSASEPTILYAKEGAAITPQPEEVLSIKDLLPDTIPTYNATNRFQMRHLTVDAKVHVISETDNYGVVLVDTNYAGDFSDILTAAGTAYTDEAFVIYYSSNKDAFIPLNGLVVTVDVVLYGLRDDRGIFNAVFLGTIDDINVDLNDEKAVAATKTTLTGDIPTTFVEAGNISLPATMLGTTITWASSDEEVIGLDGVVTPVENERISVTLTATIKRGEVTETLEIVVNVGVLPVITVADALAVSVGDPLKVKGTIAGYSANGTLVLQDETGAIALYIGGSNTEDAAENILKSAIGKVVIVEGKRLEHGGLQQVGDVLVAEVLTDAPVFNKVDITDLDWTAEALLPHQSKLVTIVDAVVTEVEIDSYGTVVVSVKLGDKTINVRWDNRVPLSGPNTLVEAEVNDIINIVDAPLGWNSNNPQIGFDGTVGQVSLEADPALARHAVSFMDGEVVLDTVQVAEGRTIPTSAYPVPTKVDHAFMGWFEDAELNTAWDLSEVIAAPTSVYAKWQVSQLLVHHKFDVGVYSGNGTGYAADSEFTWTESFGPVTVNKDRVQINKSTFAPHDGEAMLVFSVRDTHHTSWMVFDFSSYTTLSKITFEASVWNQTHFEATQNVTNGQFALEVDVDGTWVRIGDDLLSQLVKDAYTEFSFDVSGPGKYRIIYNGASTISGNTTTAITVDNLKLFGGVEELEDPIDVTFDLGYGEQTPTVQTIESGEKLTKPSDPKRSGYNFLGWFVGETEFNFDTKITEDITLIAEWGELEVITIADVRELSIGSEFKTVGVVTGFANWNTEYNNWAKAFIEDASGTIVLHNPALPADVEVGDVFEVSGELAVFNGLLQIAQGATYTASTEVVVPALPTVVTDLSVIDATFQGKRIDLIGTAVSVSANGREMTIQIGTETIGLRTYSDSNDINTKILTGIVGQSVTLNGVHVDWYNGAQLYPVSADVVQFAELTDVEKLDQAETALIDLYNEKTFNMESEIVLPETGLHGVSITWALDPAAAIADGKWFVVTEDTPVSLTATLTLGEETPVEVDINVTVKFVDPNAVEELTVTAAYPNGAGTTNMVAGNNAATIGLDPLLFNVVSTERSLNPIHIGLNNAGQIRLYNSSDAIGSILTVSIDSAYEITSVVITYGGTVSNAVVMTGSQQAFSGALTSNSTQTFDELSINEFSIQNTGSAQIYILSIVITYQ